ncbi:MAG: hypothetical protein CK425_01115 [Parachlamydia sp.]|nr:MAG: hypothetical protein CK425_01115 [Parachlamydia sp.]
MSSQKIPKSLGTHDGTFHADEVTACALLLLFDLIDKDKIVRTRDLDLLANCEYVCDVGGIYDPKQKLFDHHQVQYQGMMSSAGMVLLYLKDQGIIKQNEYLFFNHAIILGVDASDNGNDPQISGLCTYSHVVSNFTPIEHNAPAKIQNEAFFEALDFAFGHIQRLWKRYCYTQSCRQVVEEAMNTHSECLMFEKGIPWLEIFFELDGENHPAQFVIMPSGTHWKLRGIPPTYDDRMNVRFPLPLEWAGLIDEELKKVSGIEGAIFCHKGRFISVWETREDALTALQYILKKEKRPL